MPTTTTLALLVPLVIAAAAQNVLEFGLQRGPVHQAVQRRSLQRRAAGTYVETLVNNVTGGSYYASVSVGTPAQAQTVVVDTGSSDLWVVASNADLCTNQKMQAEYGQHCVTTYDRSDSSTYKLIEQGGFSITYVDGTSSDGDFISDTFSIGGATIKALQMGYATKIVSGVGVMGIAFNSSESTTQTYPNLLDQFVDQGLITSKAFSLYLNDYRSDGGSLLFGGVDTDKFIGSLSVLPIVQTTNSNSSYTILAVSLGGMSATGSSKGKATTIPFDSTLPAILDSGTTLSYLPNSLAQDVFDAVGAYTDNETTGYTFVDCDAGASISLTFTFGSKTQVTVPASQIVLDIFAGEEDQLPQNVPFSRACLFGIQSMGESTDAGSGSESKSAFASTSSYALLGDTFLRSAYVVYDLTNDEIAIAPANLNSSTSTIVQMGTGTGIPTVTGVKSQQTTYTGSATKTADSSGGAVTVTASPTGTTHSKSAAVRARQDGGLGAIAVAGMACLVSLVGGAFLAI
ncbi:aspartic-type endopeptidase [Grosmannia clavigera kw1407]|uniref:Aspartic-type endopeptidase n=1 Tax=Grosmannia clavigera (strain kw1407 / UAMH 11150) TaxID=655863 RepID=F0XK19_GROCL|nr:aspartic-type endopeptidase [Grosmannia clavigera kw1407]EFX02017.1 aspartic-type endopeptidase [Grosmannia clavigera kw1407]